MKKALITGITGQDGAYLAKLLLEKGYEVYGGIRRTSTQSTGRLSILGIERDVRAIPFELLEANDVIEVIQKYQFDEVYNLAAQSFVKVSFDQPIYTSEVTALGPLRILEAIRRFSPHTKFYQASSSEMFGEVTTSPQNETTVFNPQSPYGVAKTFAHHTTELYRRAYGTFACSGILYNHESPLRGAEFVTKKIIDHVKAWKHTAEPNYKPLELGNLNARRDWGYAAEYVEAMHLMMQQPESDTYVIATGDTFSVRCFVELAFEQAGTRLEWTGSEDTEIGLDAKTGKTLVQVNPMFYRPAEVELLLGDARKAREKLGWNPSTRIDQLVKIMMTREF